jgi:hypothetical protein
VLDPDEQRFENYLKQFCPRHPDALPLDDIKSAPRRRDLNFWALASAVAVVILAVASFRIFTNHVAGYPSHSALASPSTEPLTLRGANALLQTAPSYRAVMDGLAFSAESAAVPKDKQSALAVLGKEKIKL